MISCKILLGEKSIGRLKLLSISKKVVIFARQFSSHGNNSSETKFPPAGQILMRPTCLMRTCIKWTKDLVLKMSALDRFDCITLKVESFAGTNFRGYKLSPTAKGEIVFRGD